mmetsp:Transcript_31324/g.49075  ORF Transcript_31324/g.49075 Transcript_31324/m.49075 type:complete len:182 (-) Transcript_31324:80-625(-)
MKASPCKLGQEKGRRAEQQGELEIEAFEDLGSEEVAGTEFGRSGSDKSKGLEPELKAKDFECSKASLGVSQPLVGKSKGKPRRGRPPKICEHFIARRECAICRPTAMPAKGQAAEGQEIEAKALNPKLHSTSSQSILDTGKEAGRQTAVPLTCLVPQSLSPLAPFLPAATGDAASFLRWTP